MLSQKSKQQDLRDVGRLAKRMTLGYKDDVELSDTVKSFKKDTKKDVCKGLLKVGNYPWSRRTDF